MEKKFENALKIIEKLGHEQGSLKDIIRKIKIENKEIIEDLKTELDFDEDIDVDDILMKDLDFITGEKEEPSEKKSLKVEEPELEETLKETEAPEAEITSIEDIGKPEEDIEASKQKEILQEAEKTEILAPEEEEIAVDELSLDELFEPAEGKPEETSEAQGEFGEIETEILEPEKLEEELIEEEPKEEVEEKTEIEEGPEIKEDEFSLDELDLSDIGSELEHVEIPSEEETTKEEIPGEFETETLPEELISGDEFALEGIEDIGISEEGVAGTVEFAEEEISEKEEKPAVEVKPQELKEEPLQESEEFGDLGDLGEIEGLEVGEPIDTRVPEISEEALDLSELEIGEEKPEKIEDEFEGISEEGLLDLSELESLTKEEGEIEGEEEEKIELTDEDIEIIKNTLKNYPVWLASEIKKLILNDALTPSELNTLLNLLISGAQYKEVVNYLEKTLNIKVTPEEEVQERVYIPTTFELIFPYVKWGMVSAFIIFLFSVALYYFVYMPLKAKKYYTIGYEYLKKNNIEKSEKYFRLGMEYRIDKNEILKYGRKYLELEYYRHAEEKANLGLKIAPDDIRFYYLLSDIYFNRKEYERSIALLEELLLDTKYSKLKSLYIEIAKKYEKLKKYNDAIKIYTDAIKAIGEDRDILVKMLNDLIVIKNVEGAMKIYKLIEFKFKKYVNEKIFIKYAGLLLEKGKDFEAKDVIDRVLKYNKEYAPAYYYVALYYKKRRKPDVALKNLKMAEKLINLKHSSEDILDKVYNFIGELYLNKGVDFYPEAFNYFNKAISVNSKFARAYYNLGKIYYYFTSNYNEALDNFKKAEALGFHSDQLDYFIGWINYRFKKYKDALMRFLKLQTKYIENQYLSFAIGTTLLQLKRPELALGYLETATSYWESQRLANNMENVANPEVKKILLNLTACYNNIGVAYAELGKMKNNNKLLAEALKYFFKSKEQYSLLNPSGEIILNSEAHLNSLYILHPEVQRKLFIMDEKEYFKEDIFSQKQ